MQLTFQMILFSLMTEVMYARAHLAIVRGLKRKDRAAVLATAPTFFEMTIGAHADCTQLCVARIFDRNSAASIHSLLSTALKEKATFRHGTDAGVQKLISEAKAFVATSEPILKAVRTRRDQTLAHADARPLVAPAAYVQAGLVSYGQLQKLFDKTAEILNGFSLLYRGTIEHLTVDGETDYDKALDLIGLRKKC